MSREIESNTTPDKLTKKDITRAWRLWVTGIAMTTSTERLQTMSFCAAMTPILEKLYKTKESLSAALKRHLVFFNTSGNWGAIIPGAVVALEEQKANGADIPDEAITGLKTGLMGPMAGIGDTMDWLTLGPILIALFLPSAMEGSWVAAIMPLILFTIPTTLVSYNFWHLGYRLGRDSFSRIFEGGLIEQFITGSSILGLFMMGALSATFVKVRTTLVLTSGEQQFVLQTILDRLMPGLLPLLTVVGVYVYIEKAGPKYTRVLLWLLGIGLVLGAVGVL